MMWNVATARIEEQGGTVLTESEVVAIHRTGSRVTGVTIQRAGSTRTLQAAHVISSMPVTELIQRLDPPPPAEVLEAAGKLKYRDFLTVCLIADRAEVFPDNWIYVHDPEVKVGRIQNFKNWSPDMVPDPGKTSLGLEYFCNEGDELWSMPDAELIELGRRELEHTGLVKSADVVDGCVFRVPKSYPVYDSGYREYLAIIKDYVGGLENLQTVGRNGLHRYNNQDHSMLTGILAVRNAILGETNDLWSVNTDGAYHEETIAHD
jgi:protoporphyrinogen oxidase